MGKVVNKAKLTNNRKQQTEQDKVEEGMDKQRNGWTMAVYIIGQLYRLAFSIYPAVQQKKQKQFIKEVKKSFKRFMCWPINSSDKIIASTLGQVEEIINANAKLIEARTLNRLGSQQNLTKAQLQILRAQSCGPKVKQPRSLTYYVQISYSKKCREHGHVSNNQHMTSLHECMSYYQILQMAKDKKTRKRAQQQLAKNIETILTIQ